MVLEYSKTLFLCVHFWAIDTYNFRARTHGVCDLSFCPSVLSPGKSVHNPAIGVSNPDDRGFCINKNVTKILPPGKDTIDVEIVPGIAVEIGAGEFTFKMNKFAFKCNHHVIVVKGEKKLFEAFC